MNVLKHQFLDAGVLEPMSYTNFITLLGCYSEMKQSNWLKLIM